MNFVQRVKRKLLPPREVIQGCENPALVETIFLKTIKCNPSGRVSEQAFIGAHEEFRVTERGPDPTERGTQQFRFARI